MTLATLTPKESRLRGQLNLLPPKPPSLATKLATRVKMILKKSGDTISNCVKGMYSSVPESAFRIDLSSTEIRKKMKNGL